MQDKDFNSCLLFYPAVVGDVKIPDGLPVGLRAIDIGYIKLAN